MAFQFKPNFITIVSGLVFVVLASIFITTTSYVPYDGPVHTAYEGFQEGEAELNGGAEATLEASSSVDSSVPGVTEAKKVEEKKEEKTGGEVPAESPKIEGFSLSPQFLSENGGVYSDPVRTILSNQLTNNSLFASPINSNHHIDKFLDVTTVGVNGKAGCYSSGLSNSRGALCLTPELIQALKTRGGNAGNTY